MEESMVGRIGSSLHLSVVAPLGAEAQAITTSFGWIE
jgi:hypothetical protein